MAPHLVHINRLAKSGQPIFVPRILIMRVALLALFAAAGVLAQNPLES